MNSVKKVKQEQGLNRSMSVIKTIVTIAAIAALASMSIFGAAGSFFGAIYTTKNDGTTVDSNVFQAKPEVYLNGGPQNTSSQGLPDGTYYFQVTSPSGVLLSTDQAVCRQLLVSGGLISGSTGPANCKHANGVQNANNGGSIPVQLIPFNDTPNNGGEYKVWLIRQVPSTTIENDGITLKFKGNSAKTDNFKVNPPVPVPQAYTEVNVTGFTEPVEGVALPVVTFDGISYVVDEKLVSSVTKEFDWSVTVQDRMIVHNSAQPTGSVNFVLFSNDSCTGQSEGKGSSSDWTQLKNGNWVSGFSAPLTFNAGGAWAFQATYVPSSGSDPISLTGDCEAWPITTVQTFIKDANGATVNNQNVNAGTTVHDTAKIEISDSLTIPNNSTVEFYRYTTNNCTSDVPVVPEIVSVPAGGTSVTVESSPQQITTHALSYRAIFKSGKESSVPSVADNECETLNVRGFDLTATKDISASFTKTYNWTISKSVDKTLTEGSGSSTFNYTVKVDQVGGVVISNMHVSGQISVSNSNYWPVSVTVSDNMGDNGACTVANNTASMPANSTMDFNYSCSYSAIPSPLSGVNTATVSYSDPNITSTSATGTAVYSFVVSDVNKVVTVTDTFGSTPTTLSPSVTGLDAGGATQTYTYAHTLTPNPGQCVSKDNTAVINETGASASASVKACNTKTGALTIGFWQNKNGQGYITGQAKTGVCPSATWLRGYAPFQDLSSTATCAQVGTYVTNVIKAASSAGAAMNAMLKAQMLATALDVYFSDGSLGGNKIGAPAPIGGVTIDLAALGTKGAFGNANSLTVLQLLSYAASQSNAGGSTWYGQVKATQELAKNTFDAINNEVAPIL
jgi:hypothetical protein